MRDAKFSRANLRNSGLDSALLLRTDFGDANLSGADLYSTYVKDANWRGVNLSNAMLDCAVFEQVDLTNADLTGAWDADVDSCILFNTIMPDGEWLAITSRFNEEEKLLGLNTSKLSKSKICQKRCP